MMKKLLLLLVVAVLGFQTANSQTADTSKYLMHFSFDDNVTDTSGKNVALDAKTAGTTIDTYIAGKFGNAALFNSKPYITNGSTFNAGESFSIFFWINLNNIAGGSKFIHQEEDPAANTLNGRPFQLVGGSLINTSFGEAGTNSTFAPVIQTWYHLALVMDKTAGTVKLFIDGIENTSLPIGDPIAVDNKTNSAEISFGVQKGSTTAGLLDAYMDDFVITTEVLDATTITNIMTNGAASGGVLSIENYTEQNNNVKLFKKDKNTLQIEAPTNYNTYKIINMLGQEVKSGSVQNRQIVLDNTATGLHIIKLYSDTDGVRTSKKIIL